MKFLLSLLRGAFFLRGAWSSSWRPSRVCLVLLLAFGLVLSPPPALGQACKRKTPIHYIGMCMHPHGPTHNEWTYDFSGNPLFGRAARELVACHDVLPLFVYQPNADLKSSQLIPKKFFHLATACEPPPPPKPKPAPPPPPAKKEAPPPKEKADGDEKGGGKGGSGKGGSENGSGGNGGSDPDSVEERVEKHRIRREDPPRKEAASGGSRSKDMVLPKEGVLSKEGVLPPRDEVHPPKCVDESCTLVDRGGALPELQRRDGRALVSAVPCAQTKEGCKGEGKGNGDEKEEEETDFDKLAQQLALVAGLAEDPSHDLHRKDGKKHGIVGGEDPDGFNHPALQAAVAFLQLSALAKAQVTAFEAQMKAAGKKNLPVLIQKTEELSKEAIEYLRKKYGKKKLAGTLADMQVIGPYETMSQFTDGLNGIYEAHHILEEAMARKFGITKELDKLPSVILENAEHKRFSGRLRDARKALADARVKLTPGKLWTIYEEVYADHPRWLAAIKPYFGSK
ncbi:hypothetical protein [Polyangium fumosum]|uniref:Uncharacterized protein n=1 Tax=Polyangium fumosum TaxID=889272 RepID=A0A4U1JEJ6_9BACT|nr:hypothetical protein [Polyangium fumosum]TKD07940.1 hypothetical protein E8A74_16790 [Polyangium fumosum]